MQVLYFYNLKIDLYIKMILRVLNWQYISLVKYNSKYFIPVSYTTQYLFIQQFLLLEKCKAHILITL